MTQSNEWVEVCDDAVDSDCDGDVDGPGCVLAYAVGDANTEYLGVHLAVLPEEPRLWVYGANQPDHSLALVGALGLDGTSLVETWRIGDDDSAGGGSLALDDSGQPLLLYVRRTEEEVYSVDLASVPRPSEAFFEPDVVARMEAPGADPENYSVTAIDLIRAPEGVRALTASAIGEVLLITDIREGDSYLQEVAAASFTSDIPEENFASGAMFLPDPGGDGIPEVVVTAPGTEGPLDRSTVYVFDGTETGSMKPEDAIATRTTDDYRKANTVRRAGDLDQDGSEDLILFQTSTYVNVVIFGPFQGAMELVWEYSAGGEAMAGVVSGNGDDLPDLAAASRDTIYLFSGPIVPGSFAAEDADREIPMYGVDQMIFADIDSNGTIELVASDSGFDTSGDSQQNVGLIAAFDLSDW